jgi:hypothetical protein
MSKDLTQELSVKKEEGRLRKIHTRVSMICRSLKLSRVRTTRCLMGMVGLSAPGIYVRISIYFCEES